MFARRMGGEVGWLCSKVGLGWVMADPRKTLRIKTGVVKRLAKEKVSYEKEAGEQRQRIQIYKDQGNVAPSHL